MKLQLNERVSLLGGLMRFRKISIIGLGYIGLPTATLLADAGYQVHGVDVAQEIIDAVNAGHSHFDEPKLNDMLQAVVSTGRLRASLTVEPADVFILAVPTPFKGDHEPNLEFVETAAKRIAPVLNRGNLVILESTSPVGTTELVRDWLAAERPDLKFAGNSVDAPDVHLAYCPERVLPGRILDELVTNARVIGGLTPRCAELACNFYKTIVEGECRTTDARTAEMVKLSENSFRDVNIAFANELSVICIKLDINVWELIGLANLHPRVKILEPGPGVGGHCIAVDPWFIVYRTPEEARLIRTARIVNDEKPLFVLGTIEEGVRRMSSHPTIACFGLSFKPDVGDLRESPAVEIVQKLSEKNIGRIVVVEPHVKVLPRSLRDQGVGLASAAEAIRSADILVFLVDHKEFWNLDPATFRDKLVVDPRGIWARKVHSTTR